MFSEQVTEEYGLMPYVKLCTNVTCRRESPADSGSRMYQSIKAKWVYIWVVKKRICLLHFD